VAQKMKMTLHTLPLLPLALLFLAISHPRHCCVQATAPKNLSSFPSAFAIPKKSSSNIIIPASSYTHSSIRRRVACSLSQHDEEEEDDSFFIQASQQATQRRMKQLKDGQDPMAISLSSSSSSNTGVVDDDKEVEITEGGVGVMSEKGSHEDEEEEHQSQPSSQEVKIPIDPFVKRQVPQQISTKPQTSFTFQRKLLETRLLMDEKEKLANASKDLETARESKEADMGTTTETVSSSVATEEKIPKSSKSEDDFATTGTGPNADTTNTSLVSEKEKIPIESQPATTPRLSSDGKEIFEPSPSSLTVDPEKVGMGLLVLTRSLLALKSILDKEE